MMKIRQFRYSSDNLGYVIYGEKSAVAIDGGAVEAILKFLDKNRLQLEFVVFSLNLSQTRIPTRIIRSEPGLLSAVPMPNI